MYGSNTEIKTPTPTPQHQQRNSGNQYQILLFFSHSVDLFRVCVAASQIPDLDCNTSAERILLPLNYRMRDDDAQSNIRRPQTVIERIHPCYEEEEELEYTSKHINADCVPMHQNFAPSLYGISHELQCGFNNPQ
jgi:hypothetical protein